MRIWPSVRPRPTPHQWSDLEVRALLDAAGRLQPALRALTHQTLFAARVLGHAGRGGTRARP